MAPLVSNQGSGTRVLALLDGSDEYQRAALAAADLFGSTPRAEVTVLAPAEVAFTGSPQPAGNGAGLVQVSNKTQSLMEAVRRIEGRGLPTRMRTTEGSLLAEAARVCEGHDVLILPRSLAKFAEDLEIPVILAP